MSAPLLHPTLETILAIHAEVLANHDGSPSLRSRALLESALAAPRAAMFGAPLLTDPIEIATAYFFYLCRNDAFADSNKRVALATCLVFLQENGLLHHDELDAGAWEALTHEVAAGVLTRAETTQRLRALVS